MVIFTFVTVLSDFVKTFLGDYLEYSGVRLEGAITEEVKKHVDDHLGRKHLQKSTDNDLNSKLVEGNSQTLPV